MATPLPLTGAAAAAAGVDAATGMGCSSSRLLLGPCAVRLRGQDPREVGTAVGRGRARARLSASSPNAAAEKYPRGRSFLCSLPPVTRLSHGLSSTTGTSCSAAASACCSASRSLPLNLDSAAGPPGSEKRRGRPLA